MISKVTICDVARRLGLTLCALALMLTSCGKKQTFSVEAKIDGVGTQNLIAVWRQAPDGVISVADITAVANSFSFTGRTDHPALVEVFTAQGVQLMAFMVDGGDKIRLNGPASDLRVSGSEVGLRFAEVLNRVNEESDRNAAVAAYVAENAADPTAAALLVAAFSARGNESLAASLVAELDSAANERWLYADWAESVAVKEEADSIAEFMAFTLRADTLVAVSGSHTYLFTENESQRTVELIDSLRAWAENDEMPTPIDIYFGGDRNKWQNLVAPDSATWTQLIVPAGAAAPAFIGLGIRETPLVVTTDSLGAVVERRVGVSR